jgi:hypothetical protein
VNGYTPYTFVPVQMQMPRDFGRREAIQVIPGADDVQSAFGRAAAPMAARQQSFSFRVFVTTGDLDAAYDRLAAQVAPGEAQRLVYLTDRGFLRFTVGSDPQIQQTTTSASRYGANGYVDFTVTWRIRPDWRARYREAREEQYLTDNSETYTVSHTETYLAPGAVVISATAQTMTMDATGVAGYDLPTLPDLGVVLGFTGPCGGAQGIQIENNTLLVRNTAGALVPSYVYIPFALPTASDSVTLDCGTQTFFHNNVPFRPIKAAYQPFWFGVKPGVINNCIVRAIGSGALIGGTMSRTWYRKFA